MYLKIQNVGVAPVEAYTMLGVSTTRDCGVDGVIGKFGSGTKHAINVLLRAGIQFYVYCGLTRLEFFTRPETIDDGLVKKEVQRVCVRFSGTSKATMDLSWSLDFGAVDWTDLTMALREFVSNAIDRTIRQDGDFVLAIQDRKLEVCPVDDTRVRARENCTRVYVELTPEVERFYKELPKRFLHFSDRPEDVKASVLPKTNRNLGDVLTPMIYREGVLVREIAETKHPSLFDYNFHGDELAIDECRNSSEYDTRAACARLIRKADARVLADIFRSLMESQSSFENHLDTYYICPSWDTPAEDLQATWRAAWEEVAGGAVCCTTGHQAQLLEKKGRSVAMVSTPWVDLAGRFGIRTANQVLTQGEQKGRETVPATPDAISAVNEVWSWVEAANLAGGKTRPSVACFRELERTKVVAYREGGAIFVRESTEAGRGLIKAVTEAMACYVTDEAELSSEVQGFLADLVCGLLV